MLHQIAERFSVDLRNVTFIGDSLGDIKAAQAAGANFMLVKTGKGKRVIKKGEGIDNIAIFDNLADATAQLISIT